MMMRRITAIVMALVLTLSLTAAAAAASPVREAVDAPVDVNAMPWKGAADALLEAICAWDGQRVAGMAPQAYMDAAAAQAGTDGPTLAADLASVWQVICGRFPVRGALSDVAEQAPDALACVSSAPEACWSMTLTLTMASGGTLALPVYALCYGGTWSFVYDAWRDGAVREALALAGEPTEPVVRQDFYLVEWNNTGGEGVSYVDESRPYYQDVYEYDTNLFLVRRYSNNQDGTYDNADYTNDLRGNAVLERVSVGLFGGGQEEHLIVHCYDQSGRKVSDIASASGAIDYHSVNFTRYAYDEGGRLLSTRTEYGVSLNLWDHTTYGTPSAVDEVTYEYDGAGTLLSRTTYTNGAYYSREDFDPQGNLTYEDIQNGYVTCTCTNSYDEYGNLSHVELLIPEYYSVEESDYVYLSASELRARLGVPEPTAEPAPTEVPVEQTPEPVEAPAQDAAQLPAADLSQGMTPADIQAMPWGAAMNAYLTALCTGNAEHAATLAADAYVEQAAIPAGLDAAGLRSELGGAYATLAGYYPVRGTLTDAVEQPADYFPWVSRTPQACWSMTLTLTLACGQTFPMPLYALCYDGVWHIVYDAWREISLADTLAALDPAVEGGPGAPLLAQAHYEDIDGNVEDTTYDYAALEQKPRLVTYARCYDNDPTETVYGQCYLSGRYNVLMETHTETWAMLPQTILHCYDGQGRLIEDIMNYGESIVYQDVNYCRYAYNEAGQLVSRTDYGQVASLDLWTHEVTLPETYFGMSTVTYTYDENGRLLSSTEKYGEQTTSIKDYDEHGNPVQEQEWLWFFDEAAEPSVSTFVNSYDEQGNLLSAQEYAHDVNISTATRIYQSPVEPPVVQEQPPVTVDAGTPAADPLELIRAYWQQNIGRDCPAMLGDFDRDGSTDLVYVDDPEGEFINGYLLTVRNGAVEQINVLSGGATHLAGYFTLFARVDESGAGTLIRYDSAMYQGVGSVGFVSYYISGSEPVELDNAIFNNNSFVEDYDAFSVVFDNAMVQIAGFVDGATCLCTVGCDCIDYANYTMSPTAYQILGL